MENKDKLAEELLAQYPKKKIPCAEARAWAEKHGLDYRDVGDLCDSANIKIAQCELGCF